MQLQIAERELHRQCTTLLAIELDTPQEVALALLATAQFFSHQADGLIALHQRPCQEHEPDHGVAGSVLDALHRESIQKVGTCGSDEAINATVAKDAGTGGPSKTSDARCLRQMPPSLRRPHRESCWRTPAPP
ncbi:hypothetical protein G6F59_015732 [Rhizopus arrhizus]|nr:hypothetical protein G6F59_015732 [Rhizopus arrhizus]